MLLTSRNHHLHHCRLRLHLHHHLMIRLPCNSHQPTLLLENMVMKGSCAIELFWELIQNDTTKSFDTKELLEKADLIINFKTDILS
jgi:hypothetical protein